MPSQRSEHYEEYLRSIAKMSLMSDFFMTICFDRKPELAEKVLRIILKKPKLKIIATDTQVSLTNIRERTVRFDVLAEDSSGRKMNIEVQRKRSGASPRRARYHSSILDATFFKRGQKFKNILDHYVIFITERDYFRKNLPIYQINRVIKQTGDDFKDGSFIIYVNGAYRDNTPLGKLMHDFSCAKPEEMHYNELKETVSYFKETKEGKEFMCEILDELIRKGRKEGRAAGRKEGLAEGEAIGLTKGINDNKKDVALRMLSFGKYALTE
nr:PD-(D/E)XK nuclease family transposase [bacterium]